MEPFRADLHCHTSCSDGSLTPTQLIQLAASVGLQGISITDHDSIAAYPEAIAEADTQAIAIVPGVEFSAVHNNVSVHVLGYSFSLQNPAIQQLCEHHHVRRQQRCTLILERLERKGIKLIVDKPLAEAMTGRHSAGRPHIAAAMVRQGIVPSTDVAFKQYLGEGCPCYVSITPISVEETLEVIHKAGGLAVLAHPHLILNESLLGDLIEMPFDGIEAFYARFSKNRNQRWIQLAAKKSWLITGGSDYHGEMRPHIPLGCSWVSEEMFNLLLTHLNSVQ